jgi:hypothetical protein
MRTWQQARANGAPPAPRSLSHRHSLGAYPPACNTPGCYLARHGWVHALQDPELAHYLAAVFRAATDPAGWRAAGLWDGGAAAASHVSAAAGAAASSMVADSRSSGSGSSTSDGSSMDSSSSSESGGSSSESESESDPGVNRTATGAAASASGRSCGFAPPSLSRHDLFHGHLFLSRRCGGVGLLFHAVEYPKYDPWEFPLNLGYCQADSPIPYNERAMDLRNIIFFEVRGPCGLQGGRWSARRLRL